MFPFYDTSSSSSESVSLKSEPTLHQTLLHLAMSSHMSPPNPPHLHCPTSWTHLTRPPLPSWIPLSQFKHWCRLLTYTSNNTSSREFVQTLWNPSCPMWTVLRGSWPLCIWRRSNGSRGTQPWCTVHAKYMIGNMQSWKLKSDSLWYWYTLTRCLTHTHTHTHWNILPLYSLNFQNKFQQVKSNE